MISEQMIHCDNLSILSLTVVSNWQYWRNSRSNGISPNLKYANIFFTKSYFIRMIWIFAPSGFWHTAPTSRNQEAGGNAIRRAWESSKTLLFYQNYSCPGSAKTPRAGTTERGWQLTPILYVVPVCLQSFIDGITLHSLKLLEDYGTQNYLSHYRKEEK